MIVMPANNTCWLVHYWSGRYGNLGHLLSPARVERPMPHLPYALDNGAFGAWTNDKPWDREAFLTHVERYAWLQLRPSWVVVPDVVADRDLTLARYAHWAPILKGTFHLELAIAVQDGMTPADVESLNPAPSVVFVGGSTPWEWETMANWCKAFPRVHVGRVNGRDGLNRCLDAGVESCDGTGWFRGRAPQIIELGIFLAKQAGRYDESEDREIRRMVYHSRLVNKEQLALPMEVAVA